MGHYNTSPLYTTEFISDIKSLNKGERIMKDKGYWRYGGMCYSITYHTIKGDNKKWYEIHCEKDGKYFISISDYEWDSYGEL